MDADRAAHAWVMDVHWVDGDRVAYAWVIAVRWVDVDRAAHASAMAARVLKGSLQPADRQSMAVWDGVDMHPHHAKNSAYQRHAWKLTYAIENGCCILSQLKRPLQSLFL